MYCILGMPNFFLLFSTGQFDNMCMHVFEELLSYLTIYVSASDYIDFSIFI